MRIFSGDKIRAARPGSARKFFRIGAVSQYSQYLRIKYRVIMSYQEGKHNLSRFDIYYIIFFGLPTITIRIAVDLFSFETTLGSTQACETATP